MVCIEFNICGAWIVDRRDYYARDREDDRRDTRRDDKRDDRRDDRRRDDRDRRDHDRDRDSKREALPPPRDVNRDRYDKAKDSRQADRASEHEAKPSGVRDRQHTDKPEPSTSQPRQDSEAPVDADVAEEGEEMDATNDDDAAMMAMMGMGGFGSTKGKHVDGNQDGNVNIKKQRTWRQYMNRPLDKIK
uniref:FAD-binding FR-type domain-containing protein n=1 Tax=Ganoderma boninense TaxID=34458 RepID=A0A5K1K2M4_9APHY|nr:FAD-binding FR-type domain-containing protein [Ganoderma boninense]